MRLAATLILALAACAPRATLQPVPAGWQGPTQSVFTATLRAVEDGAFTNTRTDIAMFARHAITLPPGRTPGDVPHPLHRIVPARDMLVADEQDFDTDAAFYSAIASAGRGREALLYVHGYNNTHADGVLRTAQMAVDYDHRGPAVHFAWASAGHPLGYAHDSDSALVARDALEALLRGLTRDQKVVIAAHSMGAHLTMEALRQLAIAGDAHLLTRIAGVVLISPDIDIDVFHAQVARLPELPQPFVIFTSTRDRALRFSAGLTGQRARLGNLDSPEPVADLEVTLIDVSNIPGGDMLGHFTPVTSPLAISLIQSLGQFDQGGPTPGPGLASATWVTVRRASRLVLQAPPG